MNQDGPMMKQEIDRISAEIRDQVWYLVEDEYDSKVGRIMNRKHIDIDKIVEFVLNAVGAEQEDLFNDITDRAIAFAQQEMTRLKVASIDIALDYASESIREQISWLTSGGPY